MSTIELENAPKVGELQFVRNNESLDRSGYICEDCDCADPGTGADSCTCEDS